MADELIVQLEHPETGEYTYPKTLSRGVIIKEGKTLDDFINDISIFYMPTPVNATFNTMILQGYLNFGRFTNTKVEIRFGSGTYDLNTCVIYDNTTLELKKDTVINHVRNTIYNPNLGREAVMNPLFLNAKPFDETDSKITGYSGNGNIKINANGGIIKAYNPFAFIHGENIEFNNIIFKETKAEHCYQIGSCKHVVFNNCEFAGTVNTTNNRNYVEMIQIDWATYAAMPYWLENGAIYDNGVNDHIVFNDCKFRKGEGEYEYLKTGIGSHGNTTVRNKNIYINRCDFSDFEYTAIRPYNMENVYINDCKFNTNSITPSINANNSENIYINNCDLIGGNRFVVSTNCKNVNINGVTAEELNGSDCFMLFGECDDINLNNITFRDCNSKSFGILLRNCENALVDNIKDINCRLGLDKFVRVTNKDNKTSDRILIGDIATDKQKAYVSNTTNFIDKETNEVLFDGKVKEGSITLKESIDNFTDLRICFNFAGNVDKELIFNNNTFYFRDFNLPDELTPTNITVKLIEARLYKSSSTMLSIDFINQVNLFNGTSSTVNTDVHVTRIYGKRIRFN